MENDTSIVDAPSSRTLQVAMRESGDARGGTRAWAVQEFRKRLNDLARPYTVTEGLETRSDALSIEVISPSELNGRDYPGLLQDQIPHDAESYLLFWPGERALILAAQDDVGLMYGLFELADRIGRESSAEDAFQKISCWSERPAVPIRGIVRAFSSADEDLGWFHDREFWVDYLSFLASCRVNRFHLAFGMQYNYGADQHGATDDYLCFVYPFLFDVDGYDVSATGVDAGEQLRNLETIRFISSETKRRGMRFQLGLWNHAYDYGRDSRHRFPIVGVDPSNHGEYSAAGLEKLLVECPDVDGVTFRVHYEGGIPDSQHEIFWDKVFAAISSVGRPIQVDMHAKGVDAELLRAVKKPNIRPILSAKYWAEHMGLPYHQTSIRNREAAKPIPAGHEMKGITEFSRRFTRYGYGDFLSEDREVDLMFRVWPGTQKLLIWGDPAIAAGYGRLSTFCGSLGVDLCEPLFFKGRKGSGAPGGRDPYVRPDLKLNGREWTKYKYTYLLWGRLLYNPDSEPEAWRDYLQETYGSSAAAVENSLSPASRILPLVTVVHGVGGSNNGYWPEVYVNLPISERLGQGHYDFDTDEPHNWGGVSPFDPTLFYGVNEYVADLTSASLSAKYTPLEVASWIDDLVTASEENLRLLVMSADMSNPQMERLLIDLEVLCCMGRFFAGKFRAAVGYSVFQARGDGDALRSGLQAYREARDAFARIPAIVAGIYQRDLDFGVEASEHGHWLDRIPAIDEDIEDLEAQAAGADTSSAHAPLHHRSGRSRTPRVVHVQPAEFVRGGPLVLELKSVVERQRSAPTLWYRHVDQSETFQRAVMRLDNAGMLAVGAVPAEYTATSYPLMYFFTFEGEDGQQQFYPGLEPELSNQPYFAVHSRQWREK